MANPIWFGEGKTPGEGDGGGRTRQGEEWEEKEKKIRK